MKTRFSCFCAALLVLTPILNLNAAGLDPSPLELQAYQGMGFEVDKEEAFNAMVTVFQDLGCVITSADIRTGYISAQTIRTSASDNRLAGYKNLKFTAFILQTGKNRARVRLTAIRTRLERFTLGSLLPWRVNGDEYLLHSPTIYQQIFARVSESLLTHSYLKQ